MTPDVDVSGEVRLVETLPDEWAVDADGNTVGWGPAVDSRVRLGLDLRGEDVRAGLESDLLTGQIAGATWDLGADERGRHRLDAWTLAGVAPRKAFVGARLPWFDVEAGLQTSHWGLGILANDGASDPLFGRTDFGDRVLRLRLATQPFARRGERPQLYTGVGGGRGGGGGRAGGGGGGGAYQGVAALLYVTDLERTGGRVAPRRLGVYGVVRDQTTRDDRTLRVGVIDAYGEWTAPGGGAWLTVAGEAATLLGRTDASRTYTEPGGVRVRQLGAAGRAVLESADGRAAAHLRGAYASGDRSTDDGVVSDFRFDRDFDVGMVLFDEVLGAIDLAAHRLATDPDVAAVPPDGVDTLIAEGAVHGAAALQPAVVVLPRPWLELKLGAVAAWSTSPIAHPFYAFRNGGAPTNHLERPAPGRYLGTELDWGVGVPDSATASWRVHPSLGIQGGHAWLSTSLSGEVDRVDHLLVQGRVRW